MYVSSMGRDSPALLPNVSAMLQAHVTMCGACRTVDVMVVALWQQHAGQKTAIKIPALPNGQPDSGAPSMKFRRVDVKRFCPFDTFTFQTESLERRESSGHSERERATRSSDWSAAPTSSEALLAKRAHGR